MRRDSTADEGFTKKESSGAAGDEISANDDKLLLEEQFVASNGNESI